MALHVAPADAAVQPASTASTSRDRVRYLEQDAGRGLRADGVPVPRPRRVRASRPKRMAKARGQAQLGPDSGDVDLVRHPSPFRGDTELRASAASSASGIGNARDMHGDRLALRRRPVETLPRRHCFDCERSYVLLRTFRKERIGGHSGWAGGTTCWSSAAASTVPASPATPPAAASTCCWSSRTTSPATPRAGRRSSSTAACATSSTTSSGWCASRCSSARCCCARPRTSSSR